MSIFDRLSERVGDFLDEVMLPEEIRALHERAGASIRRGNYERALRFLGEAEHRRPGVERTRHMRGLCHFYLENLDRAEELFEEALDLREEPSTHFYLGLCFEKKGRIGDAQAHFQRALELDESPPFAYDLYFGLGRTYLELNRPDKAARELRRALRIWPDQREAAVALAEALRQRERFEEARKILLANLGEHADRDCLLTLGRIEAATGRYDEATTAFERILTSHPDDLPALLDGARAYLAKGQPTQANGLLLRALGGVDEDAKAGAEIYALIGATNERIRNLDKARQSYEAALQRDPELEEARIGAARTALMAEDFEPAAGHFEKLVHAGSDRHLPEALLGLGRCRLAMGDPAGARHLLEEADQLHPKRPPELLHALGEVALLSSDPAEALVAFREALHGSPDAELEARIKGDIERSLDALRPHWAMAGDFESTAELVSTLTELRDLVALEPRLEQFLPRIHDLLSTLDSPLSVAILGEFNAGKSTLVNAILGEEVVPMGVLPTTAHPCIMGYGPRKGARIVYEDGRLKDVDFATARKLMRAEAESIARLDYTYPHPELRSLNYWDTPGFNALDPRHEELADQTLAEAEAIIWILDANQALKETEFARLRSIPDAGLRVLLVLNKIDRFGDEEERVDKVEEIVEYLQENTGDDVLDILAISALETLRARTGEGADETPHEDFRRLMEILDEQFVQRSWQIKIAEVSRGLRDLLEEIEESRNDEVRHFRQLTEGLSELTTYLDEVAAAPEARAARYALSLSDRFDFVTLGIEREASEALRRKGRLFRRFVLDEDDREFVLELFSERLDHVLDHCRRDVLREISDVESALAERLSPLLASLTVTDARPLRRRLEGYFDETRALKTVLDERVFGQWRARTEGRISTGGRAALDAITALGAEADSESRRQLLAELIPEVGEDFSKALREWYVEFFLAANRFCDRLQRDLTTLELEVQHRLDFSAFDLNDNN